MKRTKHPLLMAIDIAVSAKAILQHVERHNAVEKLDDGEAFCGTPLLKGQMSIRPMLLALAMELALKAWIVLDGANKEWPKGHDLLELFHRLPEASQKQLCARYLDQVAPVYPSHFFADDSLERVLADARNAFVQWRYFYELSRGRFNHGAFQATIEMILSEFEGRIVVEEY